MDITIEVTNTQAATIQGLVLSFTLTALCIVCIRYVSRLRLTFYILFSAHADVLLKHSVYVRTKIVRHIRIADALAALAAVFSIVHTILLVIRARWQSDKDNSPKDAQVHQVSYAVELIYVLANK